MRDYGLTGTDGKLQYPVFEGYGNHDLDTLEDWWYFGAAPALETVLARTKQRGGKSIRLNYSPWAGHYAWVWSTVHFVNLNLYPGVDLGASSQGVRSPLRSLEFLSDYLQGEVRDSGRPVVLIHHYGFDAFSSQERWWTEAEREAYAEVIEGYNIVAIIHGHAHNTRKASHYTWKGYDVYNAGTPYGQYGHFTVFRIVDGWLQAGDVAWIRDNPSSPTMKWHTWSHVKEIDMGRPDGAGIGNQGP